MDDLNFKEILVRKPYFRVLPDGYLMHRTTEWGKLISEPEDKIRTQIVTQADFIRQFHPSGHLINDEKAFPDIWKQDPESKQWYRQPITRYAFAFQQVIATKQIVHIVGNDIQHELADKSDNYTTEEDNNRLLNLFKTGWLEKNMEIRFYEAVKSIKITGDGAIVGFFNKEGKFDTKSLSYLNGDRLYPHYDTLTGKLELFARRFYDYDDNGIESTEWVEVWDEKYLYRAKRSVSGKGFVSKIKEIFGLNGYTITEQKEHGFNFVPVAYYRENDGACWTPAQEVIEAYEESFSYLAESNKAFALPIMYFKGENIDIKGDTNGAVKVISMDTDSDAGFLNRQDVSSAYNTQLSTLYRLIYELSFTVQPPELKSGDLPGVALKLLYSPAIEKSIHDCQKLNDFLNDCVHIVKYGYGYETNETASLLNLKINSWIEPYVHQNNTEIITNIATAVQNKFLSRQTASERCPVFPKNDEIDRIIREEKEAQQQDLLNEMAIQEHSTDEDIRRTEEESKIEKGGKGQDINTGKGGRPNRSGREYDENGNWLGRDNWTRWNQTH